MQYVGKHWIRRTNTVKDDGSGERMNRVEFSAMRCLLGAASWLEYANEDLQERLKTIPDGAERMKVITADLRCVVNDIVNTMTIRQCRQVLNTMEDMELRLTPKHMPNTPNVVIERQLQQELIDIAMEKCRDCVEDGTSCKKCALYKVMEAITPMDAYSDLRCPYSITEWA